MKAYTLPKPHCSRKNVKDKLMPAVALSSREKMLKPNTQKSLPPKEIPYS
jgi:hypothetical protein